MCPRWRNVVLLGTSRLLVHKTCYNYTVVVLCATCGLYLINIYFTVACVVKEMP